MKLTVSQKKTTPISKDLIGVFFEDINYGADGGIYAELIENRNFEFVVVDEAEDDALACRELLEALLKIFLGGSLSGSGGVNV